MDTFFRDLRFAVRALRKSPGFAATAILILAVAIGASTAMFSVFDALVLRPLPYRNPEQLVTITEDFTYGVLSYVVNQRRREVGIRVALGARPRQVIELVAKQGLLPVALGIAAGLAAAMAVTRLLTAGLFEISPGDPVVYASVTALLVLTAIAASAIPARRAATVDPVIALRDE